MARVRPRTRWCVASGQSWPVRGTATPPLRGWPVGGRRWPVSKSVWGWGWPPVRRPQSSGVGCVGGQVGLRPLRWPVGGGRRWPPVGQGPGEGVPSRPFVASGWPEWGGAKASRRWPPLCGQSVASGRPPGWPVSSQWGPVAHSPMARERPAPSRAGVQPPPGVGPPRKAREGSGPVAAPLRVWPE